MRVLRTLAIAFLLAGALCTVAGSGAFDGVAADRGTAVETVPDESAYVGVDYPAADQSRTVRLRSQNADGGGGCLFGVCLDYRYDGVDLALFTDQTPFGNLTVDSVDVRVTGDDITGGDGVRAESTREGLRIVLGDFRCPSSGGFGDGDQQSASATVVIAIGVSDANVDVDLEREVVVECVSD